MLITNLFCILSCFTAPLTSENLSSIDTTVVFEGGDRYVGEWPSGKGTLYSEDKGMIVGEFEEGIPEGHCIHYKTNGSIYEGEMSDGQAFGKGRYWTLAGNVITGDFFNGTATGTDTLYYHSGAIYVGCMLNKKPHGEGMSLNRSRLKYKSLLQTTDSECYHFRVGCYNNGRLEEGALYMVTFPSNKVVRAGCISYDTYYGRNPLPADVVPYDVDQLYINLIQKKPSFPSPVLSDEQLQFIIRNCRYKEWKKTPERKR